MIAVLDYKEKHIVANDTVIEPRLVGWLREITGETSLADKCTLRKGSSLFRRWNLLVTVCILIFPCLKACIYLAVEGNNLLLVDL